MNKFHFIGGVFLFIGALVPLLSLWSWWSFFSLKRRGKTEEIQARAQVSCGPENSRQVRLVVEFEDRFGDPIELSSRSTCKDWVSYDGSLVTVVYDPNNPLGGWIELDYRQRQKLCLIMTPLFLFIGGATCLFG